MENKTNIAELLKDCPIGMELDSTMWDNITFDGLQGEYIVVNRGHNGERGYLTKFGQWYASNDAKCVIFPKGKNTWKGFHRPFRDGDILCYRNNKFGIIEYTFIHKHRIDMHNLLQYCGWFSENPHPQFNKQFNTKERMPLDETDDIRFATEEEKQKLFDAIKANGYRWNPETKTLEKLPKFKVGDKIVKKGGLCVPLLITGVGDTYYWSNTENSVEVLSIADQDNYELVHNIEPKFKVGNKIRLKENHNYIYTITGIREKENKYECGVTFVLRFSEQDNWELVPDKFDVTTLIPFESRVLVRNDKYSNWRPAIFGCCTKK